MATLTPAKMMKVDEEIGRVSKGYRSDLILIDQNDFSCRILASHQYFNTA